MPIFDSNKTRFKGYQPDLRNIEIPHQVAPPSTSSVVLGKQGGRDLTNVNLDEPEYVIEKPIPKAVVPGNEDPSSYQRSGDYGDRNDYMQGDSKYGYGPLNRLARWGFSGLNKQSEGDYYKNEEKNWNVEQEKLKNNPVVPPVKKPVESKDSPIITAANNEKIEGFNSSTFDPQGNNQSEDVGKMQQFLIDQGYDLGKSGADSDWGKMSQEGYDKWKADSAAKEDKWYPGKHLKQGAGAVGGFLGKAWNSSRIGGGKGWIAPSKDTIETVDDPVNNQPSPILKTPQNPVNISPTGISNEEIVDLDSTQNNNPVITANNNQQHIDTESIKLNTPIDLSQGYATDQTVDTGQTVLYRGKTYKYTGPGGALLGRVGPFSSQGKNMWEEVN